MNLWRALVGQFSGLERPLVELPPEALMQVPAIVLRRPFIGRHMCSQGTASCG